MRSRIEGENFDLLGRLEETALFLWKGWPKEMQVSTSNIHQAQVTLRGRCPHCDQGAAFLLVTNLGTTPNGERVGGMQCQACLDYILGVFCQHPHAVGFTYLRHFPLGKPDENVAAEVPEHIQVDFKEAKRCMFVDAYNASAEMCRRAIEASCLEMGAPKKLKLEKMIDWLEEQRKITPPLKDAAHKIRLGGNRAAHPPEDGPRAEGEVEEESTSIESIEKEHAEAILEFTEQFFEHVYVLPAKMAKYDFSKPKGTPQT